jgi:hypothetical protein
MFLNVVEIGDHMTDLWRDHADWSQATFGTDAERGPSGPLKHLIREAGEALEWPTCNEEYADCLLLILDAARRSGMTLLQLIKAAEAKLEVNKKREWPKGNPTEPVEHIKS